MIQRLQFVANASLIALTLLCLAGPAHANIVSEQAQETRTVTVTETQTGYTRTEPTESVRPKVSASPGIGTGDQRSWPMGRSA